MVGELWPENQSPHLRAAKQRTNKHEKMRESADTLAMRAIDCDSEEVLFFVCEKTR